MYRNRGNDLKFEPVLISKRFHLQGSDRKLNGFVTQIKITNDPKLFKDLIIGGEITVSRRSANRRGSLPCTNDDLNVDEAILGQPADDLGEICNANIKKA